MVDDLEEHSMETDEQVRRWAKAKEKRQAAQLCYDHQLYGESAARSYYACYQAMWAVVGASSAWLMATWRIDQRVLSRSLGYSDTAPYRVDRAAEEA